MDTNGDGVGDLPGIIDGSTTSPASASMRSGSRRSSSRRWPISATTSPTTATSTRCSARWTTSTACWPRRTALGIKVMIDQVLSHTSDRARVVQRKPREPRQPARPTGTCGPTPKPDGTPPNNWLSIFGGVAWHWEPRRGAVLPAQLPVRRSPTSTSTIPRCARRRSTTCGSGSTAASTACAWMRSTSASTTRSCATTRPSRVGPARRARLQPGQSLRVPVPPPQQHAAGEPRVPRGTARGAGPLSGSDLARRDLVGGFAGDDGRVRQRPAPAHGLQLRAADRRLLRRPTSAAPSRTSKRRWPTAGRAGRSPTTTSSAR